MDQARARVSALQLARLEESSRRMATSLRRVEPKENQDPENRLIPEDWSTNRFREKTESHIVPPRPRRQIKPTTPTPTFLWDKLLAGISQQKPRDWHERPALWGRPKRNPGAQA